MMKFKVTYIHKVEITYDAIIEAESEEEAREKMENCEFESEEEVDYQGLSMEVIDVEGVGEHA